MKASVATATRYDSVACDDGRFISPKERALAPLGLSAQRSAEGLSPRRGGGSTTFSDNTGKTHYKSIRYCYLFLSDNQFLSHADLANLTDGASLRPRLSALPSVFSRMANASVTMRSS